MAKVKRVNGCYNGNKKKFNIFCLLGFHDWWWAKGEDETGKTRCVTRCRKCHEMRALSENNADMHDLAEVRKTIGIPSWIPNLFFSWHFIDFEITDDGAVRTLG